MDKLKVFLVHFAFIMQGLWGLLITFNGPRFLVQEAFINIANGAGPGMS